MARPKFEVTVGFAMVLAAGMAHCTATPASKGGSTASGGGSQTPPAEAARMLPGYYQLDGQTLPVPADGTGFQIETPDYDANDANAKNLIVQPGQEIFLCYYVTLPNSDPVDVGGFQSWMSPGSSHHFIAYQLGGNGASGGGFGGLFGGSPQKSGTIASCGFAG